ncbi:hypothetical protein BLNAU_21582 [Blattamonas nauphoetae]|uniref:Uncharacterized protein n=1 Tax=Blattamonas nauphoetae TaxID=2049346 RepID=A0ABQ9WW08_9EUKA|nr:hypothetical protein BLNAU_21582 [Blattamonas nauphoetae]
MWTTPLQKKHLSRNLWRPDFDMWHYHDDIERTPRTSICSRDTYQLDPFCKRRNCSFEWSCLYTVWTIYLLGSCSDRLLRGTKLTDQSNHNIIISLFVRTYTSPTDKRSYEDMQRLFHLSEFSPQSNGFMADLTFDVFLLIVPVVLNLLVMVFWLDGTWLIIFVLMAHMFNGVANLLGNIYGSFFKENLSDAPHLVGINWKYISVTTVTYLVFAIIHFSFIIAVLCGGRLFTCNVTGCCPSSKKYYYWSRRYSQIILSCGHNFVIFIFGSIVYVGVFVLVLLFNPVKNSTSTSLILHTINSAPTNRNHNSTVLATYTEYLPNQIAFFADCGREHLIHGDPDHLIKLLTEEIAGIEQVQSFVHHARIILVSVLLGLSIVIHLMIKCSLNDAFRCLHCRSKRQITPTQPASLAPEEEHEKIFHVLGDIHVQLAGNPNLSDVPTLIVARALLGRKFDELTLILIEEFARDDSLRALLAVERWTATESIPLLGEMYQVPDNLNQQEEVQFLITSLPTEFERIMRQFSVSGDKNIRATAINDWKIWMMMSFRVPILLNHFYFTWTADKKSVIRQFCVQHEAVKRRLEEIERREIARDFRTWKSLPDNNLSLLFNHTRLFLESDAIAQYKLAAVGRS